MSFLLGLSGRSAHADWRERKIFGNPERKRNIGCAHALKQEHILTKSVENRHKMKGKLNF
jgi:hypothetical protein